MFQRNITSVLLGLLDTWRCKYCVLSKLRKPCAEWHCVTSKETCIISIIAVRFETLTANILAKAILCTWKPKIIWMRMWEFTDKKKVRFSKHLQNTYLCCTILENAFCCTELQHGQQTVGEIQFEILLLSLLLRKPSLSAKPPTNHSFLLAISFNYTKHKIIATQ